MKKIIIIATGGTIAMSENSETKEVKLMHQYSLDNLGSFIDKTSIIEVDNFINIPSPYITQDIMYDLTIRIKNYLANDEIKGVIVTHGTDTLEETAFFVDLTIQNDKPIIFTGSMRSSNELGADGPLNVVNSIRVINDETSREKGVLVVFNDEIHAARYVTKTHTSNVATFQSPQTGPIGVITKKGVYFSHAPLSKENYALKRPFKKVGLLKAAIGTDDLLINTYIDNKYDGIVIEALGSGNLPPTMIGGIIRAIENNIEIVLVSRCYNGQVDPIYGYEGGGKHLKDLGVTFISGLNGQKAHIKIMVQLTQKTAT
ncbi:MAG: asparaginase [Vulcanibacillus sp.]